MVQEIGGGVDELIVDDRTTERLSDVARAAEQKYRRAGRRQPVSPSDDESPFDQKLAVGSFLASARVPFVEHAPKPAHGSRVEEFVGIEAVHRLLVEPIRGRVTEKPLDFVDRATFIAPAAPNERSPDVTVEIDGLLAAGRLGNVEHQQRLAVGFEHVLPHRDPAVDLPAGPQRAQKLSLNLVHFDDADDLEDAAVVTNAEHEPAARCVGERRNRLVRKLRRPVTSLLGSIVILPPD